MLLVYVILAVLLAVPPVAHSQEAEPPGAVPQSGASAPEPAHRAVLRGSRSQGDNPRTGTAVSRVARPPEQPAVLMPSFARPLGVAPPEASAQEQPAPQPERRAVPRGSRPQGDNPRTGTAMPRSAPPSRAAPPDGRITTNRGRTVNVPDRGRRIVRSPNVYNYNYYYPRRYYPYGYGAFGLGYFYYNPYRWSPGYTTYGYPGYTTYGYYDGFSRRPFSTFDIGELRLDVSPRDAQVYVDGYYAGVVDDYDGAFQALKLESGAYRIELTAPGYETLSFDVRINPGQTIRYRGDLQRLP